MSEFIEELTIRGMRHIRTQKLNRTHVEHVCSAKVSAPCHYYPFLIMFDPVVCF
jgi:hypothetical protein